MTSYLCVCVNVTDPVRPLLPAEGNLIVACAKIGDYTDDYTPGVTNAISSIHSSVRLIPDGRKVRLEKRCGRKKTIQRSDKEKDRGV